MLLPRKVQPLERLLKSKIVDIDTGTFVHGSFFREQGSGILTESPLSRNVAKLMFMHMLGYPTHFGQMETLKLVASNEFADKRIGYLGLMLLLDERQEVLMLVTNSLKNDLNSSDQYVIGIALTALGNICSSEMARDLSPEVDRLLCSPNPYIRKKAALCARRMVHRVPDMMEVFADRAMEQLNERNHAVVLTGVTLMIDIVSVEKLFKAVFAQCVPLLCRILKVLISGGFASEYDVSGVSDPYLQAKILHLLRLLSEDDEAVGDSISDILAQVATNVDNNKTSGNAVLYECVRTIMSVKGNSGLRVLAVNILGRFLGYRDNNMRYIALSLLLKALAEDPEALQRHRNVILECIRDDDDSIRRKALDLVFVLVNPRNSKDIITELVEYLKVCDSSFRKELTDKACILIQKISPEPLWYIDLLLVIISECGECVSEDACRALILTILNAEKYHKYACERFFAAWQESKEANPALIQVALWLCGEYAIENNEEISLELCSPIDIDVLLKMIKEVLGDPEVPETCQLYALTALGKMCAKTNAPEIKERIRSLISSMTTNISIESQNRSMEYISLYPHKTVYDTVFSSIPALEGVDPAISEEEDEQDLISQQDTLDLSQLLGIDDVQVKNEVVFEAYQDAVLKVEILVQKRKDNDIEFTAKYFNIGYVPLDEFRVQAAVPKYMKLKLEAASLSHLPPGSKDPATQKMSITTLDPKKSKQVLMKIRLMYTIEGEPKVVVADVKFPDL